MALKEVPQPQETLAQIFDDILSSVTVAPAPNGSLADQALDRLWRNMERHDDYAKGEIRSCAKEGIKSRMAKHVKRDRNYVEDKKGRKHSIPSYVAVPLPGSPGNYQYKLWWTITWGDYHAVTRERVEANRRMNSITSFFVAIDKLGQKYDDSTPVEQTLSELNLNPQQLNMAEIAGLVA